MQRNLLYLALAALVPIPALLSRWGGVHLDPVAGIAVFGLGVVAAAFLISWAAELAQLEISQALALIVVAFLAVLPEYAIDLYFAWTAAAKPEYASYALANMTGANRLLVGLGWPVIVFLWWYRTRNRGVVLEKTRGGEVVFLGLATLYAFAIPLKGSLSLIDMAVFLVIFGFYLRFAARQEVSEPELEGPAAFVALLARPTRRLATVFMFLYAAFAIYSCAEPFAESLVAAGKVFGVNEFYLVQWLAPLASETPEFLVAALFCWKGSPATGLGALLSSKVNQWSLLVGTVPLVYSLGLIAAGKPHATIPLDDTQFGEVLLTAAQSFLAVAVILNLRLSIWEAGGLAALFLLQFATTLAIEESGVADAHAWLMKEKYIYSGLYMVLGTVQLVRYARYVPGHVRTAFGRSG